MKEFYENPLITRYSSQEMASLFSSRRKFETWRKIWIALAEAQKELGLNISDDQIQEMKRYQDKINFQRAEEIEREIRHDVMAHVRAYGEQCPLAKPIIHLGATSAFIVDNADIILMREALMIVRFKVIKCINYLKNFAEKYKGLATLGFTHFQPAQLTTVGKRACLWIQDLLMDLEDINFRLNNLKLRGAKGTTGTQASFLKLFDGDHEKVKRLDKLIAEKLGFSDTFPVTGQTYPRKLDSNIISCLRSVAESAHKFSNDIRLLQHLKEIEEPFEEKQVGSSAMAYKRNPMRSERMASLARHLIVISLNPPITSSNQWFERTLDDSANRRITIPEAFLTADAILNLYMNISRGLTVYPKVIEMHVKQELPFMATEHIIMEAVKRGADRQEIHERIRIHSMEVSKLIKEQGRENDLLTRLSKDPVIPLNKDDISKLLDPMNFTGRSEKQVEEFIEEFVLPVLSDYLSEETDTEKTEDEIIV